MRLDFLKSWRIILLLFFVLASLALIIPTPQQGVVVRNVAPDSPLFGKVSTGERITWANEKTITDPKDIYAFDSFAGTLRFMHNGKLELAQMKGEGVKITVEKPKASRLNFGMDITGGTRVLLEPQKKVSDAEIQNVIAILQTRINVYGLRESSFQSVKDISGNNYIQIEMAGGSREEVEGLLEKQGRFEAYIPRVVDAKSGSGAFSIANKSYAVEVSNSSLKVDGKEIKVNQTTELGGIKFRLLNFTNGTAVFEGLVFDGNDVRNVCIIDQPGICSSILRQSQNGFEFAFQVLISDEAASRFARLTEDLKPTFSGGDYFLENGFIVFYLDDKFITQLSISAGLKGRAETQPSITGFRETREDANREKLTLQSILQAGALPVSLSTKRIEQISPSLGSEFLNSAILSGVLAAVAVAAVVFVRYRKIKVSLAIAATSFSEVIIILGAASLIGYTIDLAAIAGIIATIGTGVDAQIMIMDEMLLQRERVYTMKDKIKRAFFIIFSSAATVVAAMFPLMILGIGAVRGLAITIMIGVLIGILIARPAFGEIAERYLGREAEAK